ncbi:MAG: hypothetical protein AAF211_17640 [Myxococcota bacterium]
MRFVGIDPGLTGALVAIDGDGATAVDVRTWKNAPAPPAGIAHLVARGDVVAIERPYVGKSPHAALALAEWIGWLRCLMPRRITLIRPFASEWRAKVLRRARIRRALAKRMAVALCLRHSGLRHEVASRHDVAEAWLMARYAWGWRRAHPDAELEVVDEVAYSRTAP